MFLLLSHLLLLSAAMDSPTVASYVSACRKNGVRIFLDEIWRLPGTLSSRSSPFVLHRMKDDTSCSELIKFKAAGHQVTPASIGKLAILVPTLQTFICTCQVYGIQELAAIDKDTLSKSIWSKTSGFAAILKYIRSLSRELSPFETSVFQMLSHVDKLWTRRSLLLQLTYLKYEFCPKIIDLILGIGISQRNDSRQRELEELYQVVDDTDCLWLGKFTQIGASVGDEFMNSAIISGFDHNIKCVQSYNSLARCKEISSFNFCSTNENSKLVQQLFREKLLSHPRYLEKNRGAVGTIILTKPALMAIVFDIRPEFFTFLGSCEGLFVEEVMQGRYEGPNMFLQCGGIEIGDWIWGNCYSPETAIIDYITLRKQLNNVKSKMGLYAIHHIAVFLRDNMGARPGLIQDRLDAGANPNLLTAENDPRSPLQCLMSNVVHPNQRKAIQILLHAGADTSRIIDDRHRLILVQARWTQCVLPLVLGLSDPSSLMCNGITSRHLVEVFYNIFVERSLFP